MKRLRTLLCILSLTGCAPFCNGQDLAVGTIRDGEIVITDEHRRNIRDQWHTEMEAHQESAELVKFDILQRTDGNERFYMLLAANQNGTIQVASTLMFRGSTFYLILMEGKTGELLICRRDHVCPSGCEPLRTNDTWLCNDGCNQQCTSIRILQD